MSSNLTNKSLALNFYAPIYLEATGTDAYVVTFRTYEVHKYFTGLPLRVKFANANTGPCSINWNGFGAKAIKKSVTVDLVAGDIVSGGIYDLTFDGTNFQIMPPVTGGGIVPSTSVEIVTAHSGGGQTFATSTSAGIVIVNSASANGDSILLTNAIVNASQIIKNKTSFTINIFPMSGQQIIKGLTSLGVNQPYAIPSRTQLGVTCGGIGVWWD